MRTWAKVSTPAALLAVAVMSFGGTALADTDGDHSIGGGNQADLPISLPIDISGNAVGVAGDARASSTGGASADNRGRGGVPGRTSGESSVLGGNQADAPISAPVNACGNAVSLFGNSDAGCKGGSTAHTSGRGDARGAGERTSGRSSVLGGNQAVAPITAPVNACGTSVAIFGDATAGCKGGSSARNSGSGARGNTTSGRSSVLGGNQAVAPIMAPINICGTSVAAFGDAFSGCAGGVTAKSDNGRRAQRHAHHRGSTGNDTDGRFGVGSGNQVLAPIVAPVNVCGNTVGNGTSGCKGGAHAHTHGKGAGGNRTSGRSGVAGGNQVLAPITAPVNICGTSVGVTGRAFSGCTGGLSVKNGAKGVGGNRTSGRSGVAGGNQAVAPILAPVNVCGNAAAALGDAAAGCLGGAHTGKPRPGKGYHTHKSASGSSTVPSAPARAQDFGNAAHQMSGGGVPVLGDVTNQLGLPQVPGLPGLPATPAKPAKSVKPGKHAKKHTARSVSPAGELVAATPVGGAVKSATRSLPTGELGLMSAAQPAGVTGMSNASLLALVLGGLFAVTATLFSATRRFRPTGK